MYGNNYPNDYDDKHVIDSTGREQSGRNTEQNLSLTNRGTYYGSSGFSREEGGTSGWRSTSSDGYGYTARSHSTIDPMTSFGGNGNGSKKEKQIGCLWKKAAAAVVLGLFFGACAGVGFYAVDKVTEGSRTDTKAASQAQTEIAAVPKLTIAETAPKPVETEERISTSAVVMDVSDVAAQVMPAIVSINNTTTQTYSYFGRTLESESVGAGSGIIVGESDTELLIVSNFHVVEDSDLLTVQFADGSEAEAQMKGSDPDMDLAVIAVDLAGISNATRAAITVAALGDSDSLIVGEPAIAIGNALGYGQSVTTGVVSALNRMIDLSSSGDMFGREETRTIGGSASFIQTDAAINPGNSGGALLNIRGEVIGINSNKIGGSAVEGMGYAIPISAAKPIIEELMLRETRSKVGEENKGFLGITSLTVVDQLVQDYGMPKGAYVSQVTEGSAAAKAGIMKGNIITGFDGNKIASSEDLIKVMEYYAAGDVVEVEIMQGNPAGWESKTVVVILGSRTE